MLARNEQPEGPWLDFFAWRPRQLIDNTVATGHLMRQKTPYGWRYRRMTEGEKIDLADTMRW